MSSWFDKAVMNSGGYGAPITAAPTSSYYTPTGRTAPGGFMDRLGAAMGKANKGAAEEDYLDAPKDDMAMLKIIMGQKLGEMGKFAGGGLARDALANFAGLAALMPGMGGGQPGGMQGQMPGPMMDQAPRVFPSPMQPLAPLRAAAGMFVSGGAAGGDGTSDSVPAELSIGEFVIPADVVSAAGKGSSEAGAQYFTNLINQLRQSHMANVASMPPPR